MWMAHPAGNASAAGYQWIQGNEIADSKILVCCAYFGDSSAELVTDRERCSGAGMHSGYDSKIGAAEAARTDFDQCVPWFHGRDGNVHCLELVWP